MSVHRPDSNIDRRVGNLMRLAALAVLLSVIGSTVLVWWADRQDSWQLWGVAGSLVIFALVGLGTMVVGRRWRRPDAGGWLLTGALGLNLLVASALVDGIGRPAAAALLSVAWIVSWLVLEQRRNWFLLASVPLFVLLILNDAFRFFPLQIQAPGMQVFIWLLAVATAFAALLLILRNLNRFSLRNKLITVFLIIIPLPMAILGFANSQVTSNALVQDARRNLSAAGSETARQLDEFILDELERVRNEAETLGSFDYFNGDRSADAQSDVAQLLRRARARDPLNIVSYAVLDLAGNVLFTTTQDEVGAQESSVDYLDVPLSTGRAYMSPVVFEQPDRAYFYFSNPIFDLQGSAITVLRIKYRASIWQELISTRTGVLGGESFAVLFDENFLHLAHGATQEAIFRLVVPLPDEEAANLRISGRLPDVRQETIADDLVDLNDRLATVDETPIFEATDLATGARINQVAVARMGQQPWLVAYFQPQDVLLAPIDAQARNTFVLTLVVAGIVTLATGAVAQILARPIVRLTEVATRVAEGDLDAVAPVETQDEIGVLAQTFNTMTRQLRMSLTGLETRIAERTLALRLSSEVSRRLSNILEPDELVREVVEQVRAAFNFYHVHIYLLDQQTGRLNMAGGTGEPGRIMLERGHFMQPGQGLVGRAAEQNEPILVRDVESEPRWFRNDLLPLTRSELAVPIVAAGEVLGVLDVQSSEIGGLEQQDVTILESIANQVGTALSNARSFQEAQRATEREALINRITQSIQRTSDVDEALQVAVRELGEALGSPQAHVRLRSERLANGKTAIGNGAASGEGPLPMDTKRRDVTPPGDDKT